MAVAADCQTDAVLEALSGPAAASSSLADCGWSSSDAFATSPGIVEVAPSFWQWRRDSFVAVGGTTIFFVGSFHWASAIGCAARSSVGAGIPGDGYHGSLGFGDVFPCGDGTVPGLTDFPNERQAAAHTCQHSIPDVASLSSASDLGVAPLWCSGEQGFTSMLPMVARTLSRLFLHYPILRTWTLKLYRSRVLGITC